MQTAVNDDKAINRKRPNGKNWEPTYGDRVCSYHFRDGQPSAAWPDPTTNLGYGSAHQSSHKSPHLPPRERPQCPEKKKSTSKRKRQNVDLTGDPDSHETSTAEEHLEVSETASSKDKRKSTCKWKRKDVDLTEDPDFHGSSTLDEHQDIDETASSTDNMAMKHACWTSISSTDGGEGITLQSSHEHDEENICIKEEGEVEQEETCLSIPGSDELRYEGQLVTHNGLVFTIKQEVDTDMFESLSSTEGQDPSTEQEIVYATIKQEDKEEIFESITTHGEGGGETEQSILEGMINILSF
eukprot:XP_003729101.1 PREDICTED: uncharacterized protein LOC100894142 [Strongylocentrotus purpuratus]